MRKSFLSFCSVVVSAAILLTGCSQASVDMEKIQRISDNCNTIYENVASIDTQELAENVQETAEVANEFNEWIEEDVIEEFTSEPEEVAEDIEVASSDEDVFNEDITIFDILDEEAVAEIIVEPVVAQIDAYTEDTQKYFEEANELKNEGLEMIRKGLELLNEIKNKKQLDEKAIAKAIEGLTLIVEGSNQISKGANLVIHESARTANDIVAQAELLGISGQELDMLKETLAKAQEIQIYAFSDDVVEQLNSSKQIIDQYSSLLEKGKDIEIDVDVAVDFNQIEAQLEAIPGYIEAVKEMIGTANEAAKYSQNLYKEMESSSKIVVDKARQIFKGENLEIAENAIKSYEQVGEYLNSIPTKQISDIEKKLDQIVKASKNINYQDVIKELFK